jgi:hypothetical protein
MHVLSVDLVLQTHWAIITTIFMGFCHEGKQREWAVL